MSTHAYAEVDVFSRERFRGNPLAAVWDADDLDDAHMQEFARWTNLSETIFLLKPSTPDAQYRVRIFTAERELPFAGHPTLGAAAVWATAAGWSGDWSLVQECEAGLVRVRASGGLTFFEAPALTRYEPASEQLVGEVAAALSIPRNMILDASWLVNGPSWVGVRLPTAEDVLALNPQPADLGHLEIGVIGPYQAPGPDGSLFEVRAFIGGEPVWEDPVTGSLNAGLARWLIDGGISPEVYTVSQGTALGRLGRVHIDARGGELWVGGAVVDCVSGTVEF